MSGPTVGHAHAPRWRGGLLGQSHTRSPPPGPAQAPPTPEHDPLVRGAGWKRWITFPPLPKCTVSLSVSFKCIPTLLGSFVLERIALPCAYLFIMSLVVPGGCRMCAPRVCVSCQTTRTAPGATRSRAAAAAPQPKTQTRNGRQRGARIPCTTYPVSKVHHPTRTRDVRRTGLPRAHTDHRHTRAETAEYSAPDTLEP